MRIPREALAEFLAGGVPGSQTGSSRKLSISRHGDAALMNYLDKLNMDYPFKEQSTFIKKLSMLVDRSIDVLKAYKQLTGQEPPPGGQPRYQYPRRVASTAEIINTAVRPAYINASRGGWR
jgi:hypothetical protein